MRLILATLLLVGCSGPLPQCVIVTLADGTQASLCQSDGGLVTMPVEAGCAAPVDASMPVDMASPDLAQPVVDSGTAYHIQRIWRIMTLGDSNTLDATYANQPPSVPGTAYRGPMKALADADGIPIAFVGHVIDGPNLNYNAGTNVVLGNWVKIDPTVFVGSIIQHEGINSYTLVGSYSGGTYANSLANLMGLRQPVSDLQPDLIILLAGYNEPNAYGTAGATAAWGTAAGAVVDEIHRQAPYAQIVWATMTRPGSPLSYSAYQPYNDRITVAAQDPARAGYVTFVDLANLSGWDTTTDTITGNALHISLSGYQKVAAALWPVVKSKLN